MAHVLQGLVEGGFEVDVLTPGDGVLPPQEKVYGAQIYRTPETTAGNFLERAAAFSEAALAHLRSHPPYQIASESLTI